MGRRVDAFAPAFKAAMQAFTAGAGFAVAELMYDVAGLVVRSGAGMSQGFEMLLEGEERIYLLLHLGDMPLHKFIYP